MRKYHLQLFPELPKLAVHDVFILQVREENHAVIFSEVRGAQV